MSRQPSPELARILRDLESVAHSGDGYQACCPAHEDGTASLSLSDGREGVVMHCHAGCTNDAVTAALGLSLSDLFRPDPTRPGNVPARTSTRTRSASGKSKPKDYGKHEAFYFYESEDGLPLYRVERRRLADDSKTFRQYRFDGSGYVSGMTSPDGSKVRRVLYRLPAVREACRDGRTVFVCEGEKDVLAVEALGLTATTNPGGAGKWQDDFARSLIGSACVAILPDNDTAGEAHALGVARSCVAAGLSVRVVHLPDLRPKGDAFDWIESGGTRAELERLTRKARKLTGDDFMGEPEAEPEDDEGDAPDLSYRPFPADLLPAPLATLAREAATAFECDAAMVALPALVVVSAAIGNRARIKLKADWIEPCALWGVVVAASGTAQESDARRSTGTRLRRRTRGAPRARRRDGGSPRRRRVGPEREAHAACRYPSPAAFASLDVTAEKVAASARPRTPAGCCWHVTSLRAGSDRSTSTTRAPTALRRGLSFTAAVPSPSTARPATRRRSTSNARSCPLPAPSNPECSPGA